MCDTTNCVILIDATGIEAARPGKTLFSDVSVTITTGDRIGIVGLNGSGKSTLLDILTGRREPEAGTIRRGRNTTVAVLDQKPSLTAGTALDNVGDSWEAAAVLDRLGLGALAERDVANFSGGEARRVALARTLVSSSDLLALDEPTNHLDIDAIDWLEERLESFKGALLLVTHDRHLLDRVTSKVIEVDNGHVYVHDGGYEYYLEQRAKREEDAETASAVRRNLAKREQAWLRRGAPARTRKSKAHIRRAEEVVYAKTEARPRAEAMPLHQDTPRLGDKVIEIESLGASIGDRVLFEGLELKLSNRERLGIVGPNGTGKSTLLDIIAGRREATSGTVEHGTTVQLGYFDQIGRNLDPQQRVRDAMTGGSREPDWRDAALLERFWFDSETQWSPIELLSGGERRRLQMVLVLSEQPNVLLLDEPTNDLDLDTLRSLEDFLDDWPGALVVVSHDRAFLERTVDDVIILDGTGSAARHPGGLAPWVEARRAARKRGRAGDTVRGDKADRSSKSPAKAEPKTDDAVGSKRSHSTVRHELKQNEKLMAKLEKRQIALTAELEEAGTDRDALARIGTELGSVQTEIAAAEDEWLTLSEDLEAR